MKNYSPGKFRYYYSNEGLLPIGSMSRPIRSSFPELHPKSKGTARTLSFSISWAEKFFNVEPWPMYMYASISEKTLRISGKLKFVKTLGMIFSKISFSCFKTRNFVIEVCDLSASLLARNPRALQYGYKLTCSQ